MRTAGLSLGPRLAALMLALFLTAAHHLHAQTEPAYPEWWYNQGLISGTAYNDFAAANQGEAKNFAVGAVNELNLDLAQFGGAGPTLDALALALTATSPQTSDYSVINLGTLKNLVQPFYDRLLAVGYSGTSGPLTSGTYPWTGKSANDYAVANIGQLKYLFSFDVEYSSTGSPIPDWWLDLYDLPLTTSTSAYISWSAGQLTYLQAYENALDPIDYYNSRQPILTITGGNSQTGPQNGLAPYPLTVSVTDTAGNPLSDAPVTFSVPSGGGQFQWSSVNTTLSATETLLTNSNGQAKAFFQLPNVSSTTCQITVTAGPPSNPAVVYFTETSDNGSGGPYRSPFVPTNVVGTINADGSEDMTWQNNTDPSDTTPIPVWHWSTTNNNWYQIDSVPAGTTSYHVVPNPTPMP
jgi:hypothetical protein